VETVSDALPVYKAGKYLTFRVARQDFAMSADCVRGLLPVHEMVTLETPHNFVFGFAAVGGRDFPVLDLRAKLDIPHGSDGREPFIIVVETAGGWPASSPTVSQRYSICARAIFETTQ
jgi:chemotaxis signal transduction protein